MSDCLRELLRPLSEAEIKQRQLKDAPYQRAMTPKEMQKRDWDRERELREMGIDNDSQPEREE